MKSLLLLAFLAGPAGAAGFDQTHAAYDRILHAHVRGDRFDYAALKADEKPLDQYLSQLASVFKSDFDRWPKADREAFILNLYNASMIKLVTDRYPIKSVKDIGFAFAVFRKPAVHAWGQTMSLQSLENDYARRLGDYRVHFGLVCASKGCPPLRAEAYAGSKLDEQLDDQGRRFFSQTQKNRVEAGDRTLYVSPIFKWSSEDFEKAGGPISVASKYLPQDERQALRPDFKVKFTDYDWSLNDAQEPK